MQKYQEIGFKPYRRATIGRTLEEILEEMFQERKINDEIQEIIMKEFDRQICKAFNTDEGLKTESRRQITGRHLIHNHCENTWSFFCEKVHVNLSSPIVVDVMQILTIDSGLNPYIIKEGEDIDTKRINARKKKK